MNEQSEEYRKCHEIWFCHLHPDPNQARSAALHLAELHRTEGCEVLSPLCLRVCYDVRCITLQEIEEIIHQAGFHLENSLLSRMKRIYHHYSEETQLANLGCTGGRCNCTRDIFIQRYHRTAHGCRDPRPKHWRRYL